MYNPSVILLDGDAAELAPALLAAHVAIALEVLEIAGVDFGEPERTPVEHALALQVNYQVESFAAAVVASEGAAGQSTAYRSAKDGSLPPVHPSAALIISKVRARAAAAAEAPRRTAFHVLRAVR